MINNVFLTHDVQHIIELDAHVKLF